jgi:integrase
MKKRARKGEGSLSTGIPHLFRTKAGRFFVRVGVPLDLEPFPHPKTGRPMHHVEVWLGTDSLSEARAKRYQAVADILETFKRARSGEQHDWQRVEKVPYIKEPAAYLKAMTHALDRAIKTTAHLDEWLATLHTEEKSKAMARSTIEKLAKEFPVLGSLYRPDIQRYVNTLIKEGLAPATVRRSLSEVRGYWGYLASLNVVSGPSPFDGLKLPRGPTNGRDTRKPFTPADVVKLLQAARKIKDDQLADLIELAMWTGARREELCALRVEHIKKDSFQVADAKTPAGVREVPIHSKLKATMRRLIEASAHDGYVLPGLKATKYGDRGDAIGKRFGRLKEAIGFGKDHNFHSLRRTVSTQFENSGVPENVAADILGHDKPRVTYGLYSGGSSLKVKREAIEQLRYPGL